jgi:maleylpyruvate isomerase
MTATPATHRDELAESERHLLAALDQPPEWAAQPSALPGWSRGHVVAHLLGNAEGLLNLISWARSGTRTPMYPSRDARSAAIDERSQWPLSRLRDALAETAEEFGAACADLVEPLAAHDLEMGFGASVEAWEIPMMRVREIEIHRVDLADGYTADDWSGRFTLRTMAQVHRTFTARGDMPVASLRATNTGRVWSFDESEPPSSKPDLLGHEADLLAWLIGRPHRSIRTSDGSPLPVAPRWV